MRGKIGSLSTERMQQQIKSIKTGSQSLPSINKRNPSDRGGAMLHSLSAQQKGFAVGENEFLRIRQPTSRNSKNKRREGEEIFVP